MQDMLTSLSTYGYFILFFYSLGGGMVAIIAAGVLSSVGKMDITLSIFIAILGNIIGDSIIFYLSRYNKKEFLPYLKKQRRNVALSQILFKKYGSFIIVVKKYIYGIKTIIPIAIAFTKYPFYKFTIFNIIGSIVWGISLGLLSYFMGDYLIQSYEKLKEYPWVMPLIIFVIFGLIIFYFKQTTKNRG